MLNIGNLHGTDELVIPYNLLMLQIHLTFTEACRDSSDYLLCPIN